MNVATSSGELVTLLLCAASNLSSTGEVEREVGAQIQFKNSPCAFTNTGDTGPNLSRSSYHRAHKACSNEGNEVCLTIAAFPSLWHDEG
jgi:hypothetical protein